MSIVIDSMIWIYDIDPHAPESANVRKWMRGSNGALRKFEHIVMNTVIPLEILHSIGRNPSVDFTVAYNATLAIISLQNVDLVDLDVNLLKSTIDIYSKFRKKGIGTRDASLLAVMQSKNIDSIATHDKNLLSIGNFVRIDPVFSPPLFLDAGEAFDESKFKQDIKTQFKL